MVGDRQVSPNPDGAAKCFRRTLAQCFEDIRGTGKILENGQHFTRESKIHVGQDRRLPLPVTGCVQVQMLCSTPAWVVAIDWVKGRSTWMLKIASKPA